MIAKYLRGWLKIAAWCASGVLLAALVLGRLFAGGPPAGVGRGRLFSGGHWLTGILGGRFLGAALLGWFAFLKNRMEAKEN